MTSNYSLRLQLLDAIETWHENPNDYTLNRLTALIARAFPESSPEDGESMVENVPEFEEETGIDSTKSPDVDTYTGVVPATAIRVSGGPEIESPLQDPSFRPNPYVVTRVRQ